MSQYTQCLEAENESLRYQIRDCKKKIKTLKERAWEWFAKMNDYATEEWLEEKRKEFNKVMEEQL